MAEISPNSPLFLILPGMVLLSKQHGCNTVGENDRGDILTQASISTLSGPPVSLPSLLILDT